MPLAGVGGLLVGAFSGLLVGLLVGASGWRFLPLETDEVRVKKDA
jgi:hypothetical protein